MVGLEEPTNDATALLNKKRKKEKKRKKDISKSNKIYKIVIYQLKWRSPLGTKPGPVQPN